MKILNKIKNFIHHFLYNKEGNALMLVTASAIIGIMGIYFFISITTISQKDKERVAHLYNAYTMGISIDELVRVSIFTKGGT